MRLSLLPGSRQLVSLPFLPFDDSIQSIFAGQPAEPTNKSGGLRLIKWDAVAQAYVSAARRLGMDASTVDGEWLTETRPTESSSMTLLPGEGFWIENTSGKPQTVFLSGRVVMARTMPLVFLPGLNLFGYPFSTSGIQSDSTPMPFGEGDRVFSFSDGRYWTARILDRRIAGWVSCVDSEERLSSGFHTGLGYTFQRTATNALLWQVARPYTGFPVAPDAPIVVGMALDGAGGPMRLSIRTLGEKLDVFYQDIDPERAFDPARNWKLADSGLSADGESVIQWLDSGSDNRLAMGKIPGRYYLVAASGVLREGQSVDLGSGSPLFSVPIMGEAASSGEPDPPFDNSRFVAKNEPGAVERTTGKKRVRPGIVRRRLRLDRVYVDAKTGNDARSGLRLARVDSDGPKKTIRGGLDAVRKGGTVIINDGKYTENLNIAGQHVSVRIKGSVFLR